MWILVRRGHWDMDVELKGSVGYAGLSTLLVLGYFGLVAGSQAIITDVSGTTGSTFALMVSTGILAAGLMVQGTVEGGVGGAVFILPIQVLAVTAVQVRTSPYGSVAPVLQPSADGLRSGIRLRW